MISSLQSRADFSDEDIRRYCARIVIDGIDLQGDLQNGAPSMIDCLMVENSFPIIESYIAKGYPKFNFRRAGLPKGADEIVKAFAIVEAKNVRLIGNIFGFSIFFGNQTVSERLISSLSESLINKTHFVMLQDVSQFEGEWDDKLAVNCENIGEFVKQTDQQWTLLEVALASSNEAVLALLEEKIKIEAKKSSLALLRKQLRIENNSASTPISRLIRYFLEQGNYRKLDTVNRLLKDVEISTTFAEHFRDVVFDLLRKRSVSPDVMSKIPGLHANMVDKNQNSWRLYLDAFIPDEESRQQYAALFEKMS